MMERLTKRTDNGDAWYNHRPDKTVYNSELLQRLAYYEDMEEQGRHFLPCKPGDKVYRVVRWGKGKVAIKERVISSVEYNAAGEWVIHSTGDDVLGKKCFLTREEAEQALKGGAN